MSIVITLENLGKKYTISHQQREEYSSLRDVITNGVASLGRKLLKPFRRTLIPHPFAFAQDRHSTLIPHPSSLIAPLEDFWALKDVSFEVKQGDRIGIIGRNGAGKSTLLKILSRITEPTSGSIRIKGRVASLLEVGTGFHPELTGRENVFLNGAILGMRREEIRRKFDEIVDFAEIEIFLDTPVKRYSSGMYVRLAFAVAAHLEPEILIVDEVLAVGDAQFQKKCLGKMADIGYEGRTILFVSHNMNAVEQLCSSAMLLEKGRVNKHFQDVSSVIKEYLTDQHEEHYLGEWKSESRDCDNQWFTPLKFYISDQDGNKFSSPVRNDEEIWVQLELNLKQVDPALTVGYSIYTAEGTLLYWSYQTDAHEKCWPKLNRGITKLKSKIPKRFLNEGTYRIELLGSLHFREWLCGPETNPPFFYMKIQGGLSDSPLWIMKRPGLLAPVLEWK